MGEDYNKSDWNLAKAHEVRYDRLLTMMNLKSISVKTGNYDDLDDLWAYLEELWDEWRNRVNSKDLKARMDNNFALIEQLISKLRSESNTKEDFALLIKLLRLTKRELMAIKEKIGFGMPDEDEDEEEDDDDSEVYTDL